MSIFPSITHLLQIEHAYRPITGDFLLIGRQTVEFSTLTDVEHLASICPATVKALDVSDYEGAEIIHDLCKPLPDHLRGCADFIFNGSCLDNIHDPAQAMRSLSAMLRPGGRILMFEHGTAIQGAILVFSPEWFFDFFAANGYEDCQIKLGLFKNVFDPWVLQDWQPFDFNRVAVTATPGIQYGDFVNVVFAEKGEHSTDHISPVQGQYRAFHAPGTVDPYLAAYDKYIRSSRRYGRLV